MKVLYIAFECCPNRGSECAVGWSWPFYMREFHEVYVLTRYEHKLEIEEFLIKNKIVNLHFIYVDIPRWLNPHRIHRQGWLIYYNMWQVAAYFAAYKAVKEYGIEIIHHVSMNEFRTIGWYSKLSTHYILGPVGGAQRTLKGLMYYTENNKIEEKIREFINNHIRNSKSYMKKINRAKHIFFANYETADFIKPIIMDKSICHLLIDIGCSKEYLSKAENTRLFQAKQKTIFLWSGRMEYRKGLRVLLDAFKCFDDSDGEYKLILCGDGSERKKLQMLCKEYKIQDKVVFKGEIPYQEMQQLYSIADVFIFPSIRETSGSVILEAMAHGIPVIGFNQGGVRIIVNEKNGYLVSGNTKNEYLYNLKSTLKKCMDNPKEVFNKGILARKDVEEKYTWESRIAYMKSYYDRLSNGG